MINGKIGSNSNFGAFDLSLKEAKTRMWSGRAAISALSCSYSYL
jgi:hypothetical protein